MTKPGYNGILTGALFLGSSFVLQAGACVVVITGHDPRTGVVLTVASWAAMVLAVVLKSRYAVGRHGDANRIDAAAGRDSTRSDEPQGPVRYNPATDAYELTDPN